MPHPKIGKCKLRGLRFVCSAAADLFDDNLAAKNGNGAAAAAAAAALGLEAETTPDVVDFFDDEDDPDCPSDGYSSIQTAVDAISQGKVAICPFPYG